MKIDFKKIICFGLAVPFISLSAQEAPIDSSKEITMSTTQREGPTPEGCRGDRWEMECPRRGNDDYDYDVYTTGEPGSGEREERSSSCRRSHDTEGSGKKSNCDNNCKRRGAAKQAQERD